MKREFFLFLVVSVAFHLTLFSFYSKHTTESLEVKKGSAPLEVEKFTTASKKNQADSATGEVTAAKEASGTNQMPTTQGITDGSELGILSPEYPQQARLRGETGTVLLELTLVGRNEWVEAVVLESSGYPDLDRAAIQTVKRSLKHANTSEGSWKKKIRFVFTLNSPH